MTKSTDIGEQAEPPKWKPALLELSDTKRPGEEADEGEGTEEVASAQSRQGQVEGRALQKEARRWTAIWQFYGSVVQGTFDCARDSARIPMHAKAVIVRNLVRCIQDGDPLSHLCCFLLCHLWLAEGVWRDLINQHRIDEVLLAVYPVADHELRLEALKLLKAIAEHRKQVHGLLPDWAAGNPDQQQRLSRRSAAAATVQQHANGAPALHAVRPTNQQVRDSLLPSRADAGNESDISLGAGDAREDGQAVVGSESSVSAVSASAERKQPSDQAKDEGDEEQVLMAAKAELSAALEHLSSVLAS